MEYEITFESRETFLNSLKDIEDNENNKLCIGSSYNVKFDNNVNFIIKELLKFKKIELTLFLTYTNINKIPETIYSLTNLKFLSLSGNNIDHIPISICKLQKLETIFLHYNKFKKYPFIMCDLQNLRCVYIRLGNNDLIYLKNKRLVFRLSFIIYKSYNNFIFKKILIYKILKRLIKF